MMISSLSSEEEEVSNDLLKSTVMMLCLSANGQFIDNIAIKKHIYEKR